MGDVGVRGERRTPNAKTQNANRLPPPYARLNWAWRPSRHWKARTRISWSLMPASPNLSIFDQDQILRAMKFVISRICVVNDFG